MNSFDHRRLLRARIARRFDLIDQPMKFGSIDLNFTRVRDPDRVLDYVVAEADRREKVLGRKQSDDELHLPYWAELWDSAIGISTWLVESRGEISRDRKTLDLGCGMGLTGTVAAALGDQVVLGDIERDALLFAQLNASQFLSRARARRIDWRRDRLGETFDQIIGADVLYDRTQWEFLEPFWRAHLAPGGTILLGEPGRPTGDQFIPWIAEKNWRLEILHQRVATRTDPIRMFKVERMSDVKCQM